MADRGRKSQGTTIAIVASLLAAGVVAGLFLNSRNSRPTAIKISNDDGQPLVVANVEKPVATPTRAKTPDSPAASPAPTLASLDSATSAPLANAKKRSAAETLTVSGQVRDDGGMIASGVEVFFVDYQPVGVEATIREAFRTGRISSRVKSDDRGAFEEKLDSGNAYYVGFLLDGEPQPFVQVLNERGNETSANVRLVLPKPFEVRGSVTDENEKPVPQAPVLVSWRVGTLREGEPELQTRKISADDSGRFSLPLFEPTSVRVEIDGPNLQAPFLPSGKSLEITRTDFQGARAYRIDLQVITGLSIAGHVRSPGLEPTASDAIGGATVTAKPIAAANKVPTSQREETTTTDATGAYRFAKLYPGIYRLTVSHPDFTASPPRDIAAGIGDSQDLTLYPFATLTYSVASVPAIPPGSVVKLSLIDRYSGRQLEAKAGDNGAASFSFTSVKPGLYLVTAESTVPEGILYGEMKTEVTAGAAPPPGALKIQPLSEIRVQLLPTLGIADFRAISVSAQKVDPTDDPFAGAAANNEWRRLPITTLAEGGIVTLEQIQREVPYTILVENRATRSVVGSAVSTSGEKPIKVALAGTGNVSGFVKNARGEACPGTEIEIQTGLGAVTGDAPDVQTRKAVTNYEGQFSFAQVPVGQCRIKLAGNEASARLVSVQADKDFQYDFECRSYVSLAFKVKDAPEKPFVEKEAFYIVPQVGTKTDYPVRELHFGAMDAKLEPGNYTITRVSTLQSKAFVVSPRLDGELIIDFAAPPQ